VERFQPLNLVVCRTSCVNSAVVGADFHLSRPDSLAESTRDSNPLLSGVRMAGLEPATGPRTPATFEVAAFTFRHIRIWGERRVSNPRLLVHSQALYR
jgi:hypothetical protein